MGWRFEESCSEQVERVEPCVRGFQEQTERGQRASTEGLSIREAFQESVRGLCFRLHGAGTDSCQEEPQIPCQDARRQVEKPTLKAVRDATGSANHAVWVGHPSWGCVDEFSVHVTAMAKEHMARKFRNSKKAAMCKCQHKYLGVCAFDHFICIADVELNNKPRKQIQ